MGIKPMAAGYGSKYANHCDLLYPIFTNVYFCFSGKTQLSLLHFQELWYGLVDKAFPKCFSVGVSCKCDYHG